MGLGPILTQKFKLKAKGQNFSSNPDLM